MVSSISVPIAKDIMSSPVTYVMELTPVREIARVLRQKQISGVPVLDNPRKTNRYGQ